MPFLQLTNSPCLRRKRVPLPFYPVNFITSHPLYKVRIETPGFSPLQREIIISIPQTAKRRLREYEITA